MTSVISDNMDEKRKLFVEVETDSTSTDETVKGIVATVEICRWGDGNLINGFVNSKNYFRKKQIGYKALRTFNLCL